MDILKMFEEYLKENYQKGDNQENTIKSYLNDIKQFINYYKNHFGEDVVILKRSNIIEYKDYLNKKEYKYTTINRKIASLSIYENFLIEKGIKKDKNKQIKKSDFYEIVRPFITSDMMPKKDIRKIKNKAEEQSKRDYLMFVLLNNGGLRVSEMIKIQMKRDLDLDSRRIVILGKGNKVRIVFIDEKMYDAILDYLPERELLLKNRENKYLFVSNKTANTNKPMGRTSVNNILNRYCEELKIKKINPHLFRHDCATNWYESGCSDLMLKKFLGHSSNATDIYTHQGGERLQ